MFSIDDITKEKVDMGCVALWWLGQAGYACKLGGTVIYIDPYLSDLVNATRLVSPPASPLDIVNADIVLATHDHDDHTDNGTLPFIVLSSPQALFIGPESSIQKMIEWGIPKNRSTSMRRGEEKIINGTKIVAVKSVHTQDSVGYVIQGNGISLYHSGDTGFFLGLRHIGDKFDLDIAFLPINGKFGNLGVSEATVASQMLHPKIVIPMHYGMFKENTVDPKLFIESVKKTMPKQKVVLMQHARKILYTKDLPIHA